MAWSHDVKMPAEVQKMLKDVAADRQDVGRARREPKLEMNGPGLGGKQGTAKMNSTPLTSLVEELGLPCLIEGFTVYLKLNMPGGRPLPDTEKIYNYRTHYYSTISMPVAQLQGEGKVIHRVRLSRKREFRKGKSRADWVWVRRREQLREELQVGQLDGKAVGRLEGLFSVRDDMGRKHEVSLVEIMRLRVPAKPWGKEGMIRMERCEEGKRTHVVRIANIEEMAHVIPLEEGKLWLVNNRIDLIT